MQGTQIRSLDQKIPQALVQLSMCAQTTEACTPWSLCSAIREATGMRNPCTT